MMEDTYAFPAQHYDLAEGEHGMTLRDYFAAKAMQSLLMSDYSGKVCPGVAIDAYQMADAMLKARGE